MLLNNGKNGHTSREMELGIIFGELELVKSNALATGRDTISLYNPHTFISILTLTSAECPSSESSQLVCHLVDKEIQLWQATEACKRASSREGRGFTGSLRQDLPAKLLDVEAPSKCPFRPMSSTHSLSLMRMVLAGPNRLICSRHALCSSHGFPLRCDIDREKTPGEWFCRNSGRWC